jgi:hypothetical protein
MTHPVAGLLAGVLCLGALAVAATSEPTHGASVPIEVARAECYRMIYAEPVGGASAEHFPARIILLPGIDSGAVRLEGATSRGIWWMFAQHSTWRSIGPDSIALALTNGRARIDVRARRSIGRLSGRATYRANPAAPLSPPSMRFVGEVEAGNATLLRSITYDIRDERSGHASCATLGPATG